MHSPLSAGGLVRGLAAAAGLVGGAAERLRCRLVEHFDARQAVLTDSGTSALVMAMRMTTPPGGTVALPGYSCVDLAAAAVRAGVRVRFYDLDPLTLSPDGDDLRRTVRRGVDAVVVAHLYGFAADMEQVLGVAREAGVPVIEDAAQAAGGALSGRPLGAWGHLVVLSFGRGKGLSGGGGGALLLRSEEFAPALLDHAGRLGTAGSGVRNLLVAGAQWLLGRPALYAIPASIPWLRLGETVYHPAGEPLALSRSAPVLVLGALDRLGEELGTRRRNAGRLMEALEGSGVRTVRSVDTGDPGYLRLPVLAATESRGHSAAGILRGYPGTLADQSALKEFVHPGERARAGATELGAVLFTMPTHGFVDETTVEEAAKWASAGNATQEGAVELAGGR